MLLVKFQPHLKADCICTFFKRLHVHKIFNDKFIMCVVTNKWGEDKI